jgi:abnormal spindle-like microcephaly-associated protein
MNRRELTGSPFRDVSNLRTPKPNPESPSPLFFTASKTPLPAPIPTPLGRRKALAGAATPTPLDRRLRALELDQSRSARRAESGRERALRAFAAAASSWLSLLLRDPSACGCSPAAPAAATTHTSVAGNKRDTLDGERARGSSPKRRRGRDRCVERRKAMTPAMVAVLRESLRDVCSLEDVRDRMGRFMSTEACEEVLVMMCQICKVGIFPGILLFYEPRDLKQLD